MTWGVLTVALTLATLATFVEWSNYGRAVSLASFDPGLGACQGAAEILGPDVLVNASAWSLQFSLSFEPCKTDLELLWQILLINSRAGHVIYRCLNFV